MGAAGRLLRSLFVHHRTIVVDGVRYRERTTEPLHRALTRRHGRGKEYDVLFENADPLRIRCTPQRLYADLLGEHVLEPYRLADPIIRPGMRVLDARCSTGYGAAHLARRVGPSGAVVAFDPDHESIRFARRRYCTGNIAFEIGSVEALHGELDASFDAIVAINFVQNQPIHPKDSQHESDAGHEPSQASIAKAQVELAELWRVLSPRSPMLLVQPLKAPGMSSAQTRSHQSAQTVDTPMSCDTPTLVRLLELLDPEPIIEPADADDLAALIVRKPDSQG